MQNQSETFERRYWETTRRQALAPAIGQVALDNELTKGLELRRYKEIISGLAEGIDGVVSTDPIFEIKNGKVIAEDGEELESAQRRYLQDTIIAASNDNFYADFWPQRARHELDELLEIQAMSTGKLGFNSIVTISPYTEELAGSKQNNHKLRFASQKPDWQRAMIRLSRWDGQNVHISTRSLDNSSVDLLKQSAKETLGYEYQASDSTKMLGERIYLNINDNQVVDQLVGTADSILSRQRGGVWQQGRQNNAHNTQKYVESQTAILSEFFKTDTELALAYNDFESYQMALQNHMYNYVSLLENRLYLGKAEEIVYDITAAASTSGYIARSEGKVYDMCGLVLTANGKSAHQAKETGFESLQRLTGKKVNCPACKEKVDIANEKLSKGILCCRECKFEIDACTGKVLKMPNAVKTQHLTKQPIKETDWQKIVREDEDKKLMQKLKRRKNEMLKNTT